MKKKQLYIGISILVVAIIITLLGWALFIGQQQQELQKETEDLGYFDSALSTPTRGGGGLFGGSFGDIINNVSDTGKSSEQTQALKPRLRQLYNLPTAGFIKKQSNAIRFVDKATGHIFEKDLPDGATTRLDQTTIPQVQKAFFTENGDGVIRRYVDSEGSLVAIYSNLEGEEVQNTSLPLHLFEITSDSQGSQIGYLQHSPKGSELHLSNPNGSGNKSIMSSALRGWNIQWENESLLISQHASSKLPGSAYILNPTTGIKTLVLQQMKGLVTLLNPAGDKVLYSHSGDRKIPLLSVKDITTNKTITLDVASLAEKCAWHPNGVSVFCALPNAFPDGEYPDVWYQGRVHFSDSLFEIRTDTKEIVHIISPKSEYGVSLDIINLTPSTNGKTLFFINKTDQTLWSVTIPKEKSALEESGVEEEI